MRHSRAAENREIVKRASGCELAKGLPQEEVALQSCAGRSNNNDRLGVAGIWSNRQSARSDQSRHPPLVYSPSADTLIAICRDQGKTGHSVGAATLRVAADKLPPLAAAATERGADAPAAVMPQQRSAYRSYWSSPP